MQKDKRVPCSVVSASPVTLYQPVSINSNQDADHRKISAHLSKFMLPKKPHSGPVSTHPDPTLRLQPKRCRIQHPPASHSPAPLRSPGSSEPRTAPLPALRYPVRYHAYSMHARLPPPWLAATHPPASSPPPGPPGRQPCNLTGSRYIPKPHPSNSRLE